jgi:hypothetical protein
MVTRDDLSVHGKVRLDILNGAGLSFKVDDSNSEKIDWTIEQPEPEGLSPFSPCMMSAQLLPNSFSPLLFLLFYFIFFQKIHRIDRNNYLINCPCSFLNGKDGKKKHVQSGSRYT